jgi:hypothetical protein
VLRGQGRWARRKEDWEKKKWRGDRKENKKTREKIGRDFKI